MIRKFSNSIWAVLEYLWNPLLALICTPLFLRVLGPEKYGFWMLALAAVASGVILNAGTGAATIKLISAESGKNNHLRLESALRGSFAVALTGGAVLALVIAAVFWAGDDLLFKKMGNRSLLHLTGMAAAALAWIEQIDNVFASALKGGGKYGLAARVEMIFKAVQVGGLLLGVGVGGGLPAVYAILIVTGVVRFAAKAVVVRQVLPIHSLKPDWSQVGAILEFSKWGWLQGLGAIFFNTADRFFVGSLLGAASLAQYAVVSQLASQVHGLVAAAISVVFPLISRKQAATPAFSVLRATGMILIANVVLCSFLALLLLALGKWILHFWLGAQASIDLNALLEYLIVAYWLLALNITPYYVLLGLGKIKPVTILTILSGFISVFPMIYGVIEWGLIGAGVGRMVYAVSSVMLFIPLVTSLREVNATHAAMEGQYLGDRTGSHLDRKKGWASLLGFMGKFRQ